MKEVQGPDLLTSAEVAAMFRVSLSAVARWVHTGKLTGFRTPGGRLRLSRAEVEALLNRSES